MQETHHLKNGVMIDTYVNEFFDKICHIDRELMDLTDATDDKMYNNQLQTKKCVLSDYYRVLINL